MILYKKPDDIAAKIAVFKKENKIVGFIPTMGALHAGHLSLIEASRKQDDITVCSIFVNPTQFNDINDFNKYPVTIEKDIQLLTEAGATLMFLPAVEDIYPEGKPVDHYDLGELETILEGQFRPGHFQGVCQVVYRLFKIIQPHKAYFGQKDYQQCMVIKKLVDITQLPIEIIIHPTVRETSGLAMSSRNMRLNGEYKERAVVIYNSLLFIKKNKETLPINLLSQQAKQLVSDASFEKIDYVEIRDAETLQPVTNNKKPTSTVALVAAYLNGVRLIDNMLL